MAKVYSTEDGNLNSSIRVVKKRDYSDLDLSFSARTVTDGDVYRKVDAAAVKQSIKTLLLTNRFEKPYRPDFGANLSGLLFSLADGETGPEITDRIRTTIDEYEPRAEILSIEVSSTPDYNVVYVRVEFRVISTNVVDVLDLKVTDSPLPAIPVTPPTAVLPPIVPVIPVETVDFEGMILAADGSAIKTADGKVLIRESGVDETLADDDALTTQGGQFLYAQDGSTLLLIQGAVDSILTIELDTLITEDGRRIKPDATV